jgi:gliding motility-associated-like protein
MKKKYGIFWICLFQVGITMAQLNVTVDSNALRMAQIIVGPGIAVSNARLTGPYGAAGTFSGSTNMGIDSGVILTNGLATNAIGPNDTTVNQMWGSPGDTDLANLINEPVSDLFDACALEFDILAPADTIVFSYVFGSEEYPDFVCSQFNDAFGLFISGPGIAGLKNIALIPGTTQPVSINSINNGEGPGLGATGDFCTGTAYPQYFINNGTYDTTYQDIYAVPNSTSPYYIQYNGFTTILNAGQGGLTPCSTYHLKMVISDVGDSILDSGIFIKAGFGSTSNTNNLVVPGLPYTTDSLSNVAVAGCSKGIIPIQLLFPDTAVKVVYFQITGTAINGVNYNAIADSVTFMPGQTLQNVSVLPIANGLAGIKTVILSVTSQCGGVTSDTLFITGNFSLAVTPHDTTVCAGAAVNLQASPGLNYNWTPATGLSGTGIANPVATPLVSTTYICTSSVGTCTASDSVHIAIAAAFNLVVTPRDTAVCPGQSVTLMASGGLKYSWTPSAGLSNDTIANPLASPVVSTNYICSSTISGCTAFDTASVSIISPFSLSVTPHDTTICAGQSVALLAAGGANYVWTPATGLSASAIANPVANPLVTTTYVCTSSAAGCSSSDSVHIIVSPAFSFALTPHDTTICPGSQTITINAGVYQSYLWQNGSNQQYFSITGAGTYRVVVTNASGCTASDSVVVEEKCAPVLPSGYFIPNVFTPNGDGNNDDFFVEMQAGATLLSFEIFDRWGEKVHDGLYPWDGNYKGKPAPQAVYVYLIKIKLPDLDLAIERKGSVSLLR